MTRLCRPPPSPVVVRLYHVVVIHQRTGRKGYMTLRPVTHAEGMTILSKMSRHAATRKQLEEAVDHVTCEDCAGAGCGACGGVGHFTDEAWAALLREEVTTSNGVVTRVVPWRGR